MKANGTAAAGLDTRKYQGKTAKQQKKTGGSASAQKIKSQVAGNGFEVLGSADEDKDSADDASDSGSSCRKKSVIFIANYTVSAWNYLGLSPETTSSLARLRFTNPTSIQKSTIPEITAGHDVIGKAPTGSGKTLAFGIPIYEHFIKTRYSQTAITKSNDLEPQHCPIALIISPTRELAHQLSTHIADLCSDPSSPIPSIATVTGGLSVHKQQRQLATADIIVGTPGRLWEVVNGSLFSASLKQIKFLIIDEADRLLSEGHFKEMQEILNVLDRSDVVDEVEEAESEKSEWKQQRQTLVFSATFQKDLQQKLAGREKAYGSDVMGKNESMEYLLRKLNFREEKPKFIDVNPISQMASGLKESIVECAGTDKVRHRP